MGHIDASDAVAAKCEASSTLADPLQRYLWQYNQSMIHYVGLKKIETMLTSAKARSTFWNVVEFGK
jgi:hypothetical protein